MSSGKPLKYYRYNGKSWSSKVLEMFAPPEGPLAMPKESVLKTEKKIGITNRRPSEPALRVDLSVCSWRAPPKMGHFLKGRGV